MQVFNAEEWEVSSGKTELSLETRHFAQISISSTKEVTVSGMRGNKKLPLKSGTNFTMRARLVGFEALILQGTGATSYGYSLLEYPQQDGDPIDHENPPAAPMPGEDNILLKVRRLLEAQARNGQPTIFDPEDLPGAQLYEIDDDDLRFEEEIHAEHLSKSENPKPAPVEPKTEGDAPAAEPQTANKEPNPAAKVAAE